MKYIKGVITGLLFVLLVVATTKNTWSAYLLLTRIGTLSTSGITNQLWSVTGAVPDFSGTATPSAMVAITVNAVTATTSAALNGIWISRPTNIVTGNNSVSIASGNEVISFILSYTPAATPTPAPTQVSTISALPETGGYTWPMIMLGAGAVVFIFGRQIKGRIEEEWNN